MVCGGLPAVFLLFLQRFVLIHGSTLIREDTPGSEMSVMEFGYDPNSIKGPRYWNMKWPSCGFSRQSPIDINTTYVTYGRPYEIRYNQENQDLPGNLINNGHTTAFYFEEKARYLYGVPGSPKDKFLLNELHFHFGNDRIHGSEHSINGQFFPIEVHMVHYNSKYRQPRIASMMPDGIIAVSVFLRIRSGPPNHVDTFIKTNIPRVKDPKGKAVKADLNPSLLLPFKRDFYTYRGSVSVPPCKNNIRWIIMKETRDISIFAYRAFLTLKTKEGEIISKYGNFRPIQDSSCNRLVEANFMY
ncbi:CA [Mytilus coruscus]|uniref:Carbonic anhydrase n=1 Tax=Mytilus coruscus TaxID=42192 RepID=A0A6J8CZJ0_MYTCO|nr:CA [Mytilus coruscus]